MLVVACESNEEHALTIKYSHRLLQASLWRHVLRFSWGQGAVKVPSGIPFGPTGGHGISHNLPNDDFRMTGDPCGHELDMPLPGYRPDRVPGVGHRCFFSLLHLKRHNPPSVGVIMMNSPS